MTGLIPCREVGDRQLVDARDLHAALGVETRFDTWISRRVSAYEFKPGEDFEVSLKSEQNPHGGRPATDYMLSISMAKELAMVENNAQGRKVRLQLIALEKAWNSPEAVMSRALRMADANLARLRGELSEIKVHVAELEPKAEVYDRFLDATNTLTITQAAESIGRPPRKLMAQMKSEGVLKREHVAGTGDNPYIPTSYFLDKGYFIVVPRPVEIRREDGSAEIVDVPQARVTPRGVEWMAKRYPRTEKAKSQALTH